jgi:hypothetical protein
MHVQTLSIYMKRVTHESFVEGSGYWFLQGPLTRGEYNYLYFLVVYFFGVARRSFLWLGAKQKKLSLIKKSGSNLVDKSIRKEISFYINPGLIESR